ncbi:amino acid permease 3-like [Dorcoceras hygrometricum]|uniref:Amino acid permease 3-like n=1 Tax=Dorcoceras hygrometricum TaxID=472368 RepID=A0A2Z7BQK0_9LAMI|nr:amino acid permease 3-like [Dorcoceras hygrometricum]
MLGSGSRLPARQRKKKNNPGDDQYDKKQQHAMTFIGRFRLIPCWQLVPGSDRIGYPRMSASGESSTTMHRLLHASGSHPIPTPYDPNSDQCRNLDSGRGPNWAFINRSTFEGPFPLCTGRSRVPSHQRIRIHAAPTDKTPSQTLDDPSQRRPNHELDVRPGIVLRLIWLELIGLEISGGSDLYLDVLFAFSGFGEQEEWTRRSYSVLLVHVSADWVSVQIVLLSFRSELLGTLVVVIVAQKLSVYAIVLLFLAAVLCWFLQDIVDASIEDERQYRAPHLPADLVVRRYETSG